MVDAETFFCGEYQVNSGDAGVEVSPTDRSRPGRKGARSDPRIRRSALSSMPVQSRGFHRPVNRNGESHGASARRAPRPRTDVSRLLRGLSGAHAAMICNTLKAEVASSADADRASESCDKSAPATCRGRSGVRRRPRRLDSFLAVAGSRRSPTRAPSGRSGGTEGGSERSRSDAMTSGSCARSLPRYAGWRPPPCRMFNASSFISR